jgi:hypothetical protein
MHNVLERVAPVRPRTVGSEAMASSLWIHARESERASERVREGLADAMRLLIAALMVPFGVDLCAERCCCVFSSACHGCPLRLGVHRSTRLTPTELLVVHPVHSDLVYGRGSHERNVANTW